MIKIKTALSEQWFTPSSQKDQESPARMKIKPLNGMEFNNIQSGLELKDGNIIATGEAISDILGYGLVDWEGIEAERGALPCTQFNHRFLPWQDRQEIASKIIELSILGEDERKN